MLRARGDYEAAIEAYLSATYAYDDQPVWAARGLQGAAQSYVARQMPREAGIVLPEARGPARRRPALAQWARDSLGRPRSGVESGPAGPGRRGAAPKP
jgi:hypothetical protein